MLKKLFFDGPQCDGVFRKSANHAKFQAVKQALDNGEDINFDEMPVLMTAVLLKVECFALLQTICWIIMSYSFLAF